MDFDLLCQPTKISIKSTTVGDNILPMLSSHHHNEQNFIENIKLDFGKIISNFNIPPELKNDIIYCQKSLIDYLRIHQIVVTQYGKNLNEWPQIQKNLEDLEREMYEINAEQKFLLLHLHRKIEDFYNSLTKNVIIDHSITKEYFKSIFNRYMTDLKYRCLPFTVKKRKPMQALLSRFGFFEINEQNDSLNTNIVQFNNIFNSGTQLQNQVSLLKPKSERLIVSNISTDSDIKSSNQEIKNRQIDDSSGKYKIDHVKTSSVAINNSRMNLLQALNKAKNQSLLSGTTANQHQSQHNSSKSDDQSGKHVSKHHPGYKFGILKKKTDSEIDLLENIKTENIADEYKLANKITENTNRNERKSQQKPREDISEQSTLTYSTTTSEDSLDWTNAYPKFNDELPEPTEYNQEQFLRIFGLYTIEHSIYLQQRRSKRTRRMIQRTEKKEYHYGNMDNKAMGQLQKEKKKKIFLASPPPKRRRQNYNKSTERKNDKILCKECNKNGDAGLSQCEVCKKYFHAKCHTGAFARKALILRSRICPSCYKEKGSKYFRTNTEEENKKIRRNALLNKFQQLRRKFNVVKSRKENLLKQGQEYKTKMNELYSLVDKIKNESNADNNLEPKDEMADILSEIEIKEEKLNDDDSNSITQEDDSNDYQFLQEDSKDSVSFSEKENCFKTSSEIREKSSSNSNLFIDNENDLNSSDEGRMIIDENQQYVSDEEQKISTNDQDNFYKNYSNQDEGSDSSTFIDGKNKDNEFLQIEDDNIEDNEDAETEVEENDEELEV